VNFQELLTFTTFLPHHNMHTWQGPIHSHIIHQVLPHHKDITTKGPHLLLLLLPLITTLIHNPQMEAHLHPLVSFTITLIKEDLTNLDIHLPLHNMGNIVGLS
jgi:hypothetical protein